MIEKNDYKKSKVLLLHGLNMTLVDGTIQTPIQRLSTLKHYHRNDPKFTTFLNNCMVKVLEDCSCNTRFELWQRVKFHEMTLKAERTDNPELKALYVRRLDTLSKKRKVRIIEPVSFKVDFDV